MWSRPKLAALAALAIASALWFASRDQDKPPAPAAVQSAPTAAAAVDERREAAFQKAILMVKAVKLGANDPTSIEVAEAFYLGDGTVVVKFRGRNAFNAMIVNYAVTTGDGKHAVSGTQQQISGVWNRYVAGKPISDLTYSMQGAKMLGAY